MFFVSESINLDR